MEIRHKLALAIAASFALFLYFWFEFSWGGPFDADDHFRTFIFVEAEWKSWWYEFSLSIVLATGIYFFLSQRIFVLLDSGWVTRSDWIMFGVSAVMVAAVYYFEWREFMAIEKAREDAEAMGAHLDSFKLPFVYASGFVKTVVLSGLFVAFAGMLLLIKLTFERLTGYRDSGI